MVNFFFSFSKKYMELCQNIRMNVMKITVKHFIREDFIFRVNSREHRHAKIKSSPIISIIRIIKEDMTNRENKVS